MKQVRSITYVISRNELFLIRFDTFFGQILHTRPYHITTRWSYSARIWPEVRREVIQTDKNKFIIHLHRNHCICCRNWSYIFYAVARHITCTVGQHNTRVDGTHNTCAVGHHNTCAGDPHNTVGTHNTCAVVGHITRVDGTHSTCADDPHNSGAIVCHITRVDGTHNSDNICIVGTHSTCPVGRHITRVDGSFSLTKRSTKTNQ